MYAKEPVRWEWGSGGMGSGWVWVGGVGRQTGTRRVIPGVCFFFHGYRAPFSPSSSQLAAGVRRRVAGRTGFMHKWCGAQKRASQRGSTASSLYAVACGTAAVVRTMSYRLHPPLSSGATAFCPPPPPHTHIPLFGLRAC